MITSLLRRPRRCTNRLKTYCPAAATKLFDSELHFFSWSLSPLQNTGPCDSFHCLGHFKNVYDDNESVFQRYDSEKHLSEFYPQDGDESQLASKLRHYHPIYSPVRTCCTKSRV